MMKVRIHYAVSTLTQAAAETVLDHNDEVERHVREVKARRARLADYFRGLGAEVLPSATNFIALRLGDAELAERLNRELLEAGRLIARPAHPDLGISCASPRWRTPCSRDASRSSSALWPAPEPGRGGDPRHSRPPCGRGAPTKTAALHGQPFFDSVSLRGSDRACRLTAALAAAVAASAPASGASAALAAGPVAPARRAVRQ